MNTRYSIRKSLKNNDTDENNDKPELTDIYREENHVYFYTDITCTSISKLTTLLREAEEYCVVTALRLRIDSIPIHLHMYSNGGEIYAAFIVIDVIEDCRVPVYSIIEGATASAGTLISIVCNKRYIRPRAHMLIHQLSSACWGKMSEIADEYQNMTELMKKIKDLYIKYTTINKKKLEQLLAHDLWLDSARAIEYGLVDEIYTRAL